MHKIEEIIKSEDRFPRKITRDEGEYLKKKFDLLPDSPRKNQIPGNKSIEYIYKYHLQKHDYFLIEEYLFRDREFFLEIKRAIGKNFYLTKGN